MSSGDERRGVFLVTGIQAAGKSTVGRALAQRFARAAFIEGDVMWKLVVSGNEDMTPDPSEEAVRQYALRVKHGAMLADSFLEAGFNAVHSDIVGGDDLARYAGLVRGRPLYVVALHPSASAAVRRERERGTTAYRDWEAQGKTLEEAIEEFRGWYDASPRLGVWI